FWAVASARSSAGTPAPSPWISRRLFMPMTDGDAHRRYQPNFQIPGKDIEFASAVLDTAAHGYASCQMPDQGKGRQSRLAVSSYFMQTMLRRSRCTSDRCFLSSGWSSAVSPLDSAVITKVLSAVARPVRLR